MKRVLGNFVGAVIACCVFMVGLQAPAMAKAVKKSEDQAAKAAVVSDEGIYQLYQNRSWLWGKDGAAFFAARKRQVDAWNLDKGNKNYAEGSWFIPGGGKLCFRATWHGSWGAKQAMSCFEHRQAGKVIYQRKLPDGKWYAFSDRHGKSQLRYGDYVSAKVKRIKARL